MDYQKAGDVLGPGRVERDIVVMYEYRGMMQQAEQHLLTAKSLLESQPQGKPNPTPAEAPTRDAELGITLAKIGQLYTRTGKLTEADQHLIDGLTLVRKAGHPFYETTALMHLAALYFATGHYGRMLANAQAALGLIYEHGMYTAQTRRLAQIYGLMAHGYMHCGHMASAKHYAKKSLDIINILSRTYRSRYAMMF